ncbi:hypothetical protein BH10PSE15_BH10PSE15_08780 [soil metagenome]
MTNELIVLMLREIALRCALIGQLTTGGETVLSFDGNPLNIVIAKTVTLPAILIIDEPTLGAHLCAIRKLKRWDRIIVLSDRQHTPEHPCDPNWIALDDVPAGIIAVLRAWRTAVY